MSINSISLIPPTNHFFSKIYDIPTKLPTDLFFYTAQWLDPFRLRTLCSQNQLINSLVSRVCIKAKHLDLSKSNITNEGLARVINLYPNIRGLNISQCKMITMIGIQLLGRALQSKRMSYFNAADCQQKKTKDLSGWLELIKQLDFTELEVLDLSFNCSEFSSDKSIAMFINKLYTCTKLKNLVFNTTRLLSHEQAIKILNILPKTIENFSLNSIQINEEIADLITDRFDLKTFRKCSLKFINWSPIKTEKIFDFLKKLPLSEMTDISIQGEDLTEEIVEYIANKIEKNEHLQTFELTQLNEEISNLSIEHLVQSIVSKHLRRAYIYSLADQNNRDLLYLNRLLIPKFSYWPKIESISIEGIRLSNLTNIPPPLSLVRFLFQIEKGGENGWIKNQIESLNRTPMATILNHYAQLHNAISPDRSIDFLGTLAHFNRLSIPPQNLHTLQPLDLIRRLENLIQLEKQLARSSYLARSQADQIPTIETRFQSTLRTLYDQAILTEI